MGIKYIDLRDSNGHQSSIGIYDGAGSVRRHVRIVGVIPHGAEYDPEEFDRFARKYAEIRGATGIPPAVYVVGRNRCTCASEVLCTFETLRDAESFVGYMREEDPEGVERGDYYIDGPCGRDASVGSEVKFEKDDLPVPSDVLDPDGVRAADAAKSAARYARDPYIAGLMARAGSLPGPKLAYPDCPSCVNYSEGDGYGPSHIGSMRCESGSIASGGSRAHCSCDTCF